MSILISASDIERAKKLAKQSISLHPHLSYTKRLDYAAQQLFSARSYHELNKWREATIQNHVVATGGTSVCSYCGLNFCPDLKEDQKQHREEHDAFEKAVTDLHYIPEHYNQQEIRKKDGYARLSNGVNTQQRVAGALDVMRSWFDRSLRASIRSGYWKQHPKFEEYISYMIGGLNLTLFPQDVISELESRFGRIDGVIKKGYSYWHPRVVIFRRPLHEMSGVGCTRSLQRGV